MTITPYGRPEVFAKTYCIKSLGFIIYFFRKKGYTRG
jgi:hypothetical protein